MDVMNASLPGKALRNAPYPSVQKGCHLVVDHILGMQGTEMKSILEDPQIPDVLPPQYRVRLHKRDV